MATSEGRQPERSPKCRRSQQLPAKKAEGTAWPVVDGLVKINREGGDSHRSKKAERSDGIAFAFDLKPRRG